MTPHPQAVLDAVVECGSHPTAAEIYEQMEGRVDAVAFAGI